MKSRLWLVLIAALGLSIGTHASQMSRVVVLHAGTVLNIRTAEPMTADYIRPGMRVRAIVDDPVVDAHGQTLIRRGSPATLEVTDVQLSSSLKGRDRIFLKVLSLNLEGRSCAVTTNRVELKGRSEGDNTTRKVIGGAGIGAALGGIFGGGTGAAIGAAAGGTTGAVVAGSEKQHLNVPAETRLQFRLDAPVSIR